MPPEQLEPLVRHVRRLAGAPSPAAPTDAELLRRFVDCRDEDAFAALVGRYGRLVRAVCRHVLPGEADAEDAVQATLLILARKADSIRKRESVAGWLYGVAHRTALRARRP
jgi:DNA-directed RNA polymerase specialized sigma24 family protein